MPLERLQACGWERCMCFCKFCWWVSSGRGVVFVLEEAPRAAATELLLIPPLRGPASVGGARVWSQHIPSIPPLPLQERCHWPAEHQSPALFACPSSLPRDPRLSLLLPRHCAICCYCKYVNRSTFIWSTPRMSSMNSFPYFRNANGLMYVLILLGPEPLIVILSNWAAGNCVCVYQPQPWTEAGERDQF